MLALLKFAQDGAQRLVKLRRNGNVKLSAGLVDDPGEIQESLGKLIEAVAECLIGGIVSAAWVVIVL